MSDTPGAVPQHVPRTGAADRPLRILHVLDHSLPLHSGYTFRTLAILRQQRALGWETFHLTGPKQGSGQQREEHIDDWIFYRTPPASGLLAKLPIVHYHYLMKALQTRLAEVVAEVQPDIIHAHSPVLNAFPALAVGRAAGIPVVYEVRAFWEDAAVDQGTAREWGPRYRLTRALETRALQQADAVTTICDGLCGDMLKRGIPADKITVIPNAVNLSQFRFTATADPELVQKYGLTRGNTLGFAGSFYAYEGLDILLRAMPLVLRAVPQARLLLLGGGPQEADLHALAVHLGLEDVVHFTGRVPHSEMTRYYSAMDVMVYPRVSRRLTDLVTPLKPLEAMAMGKLVVASDIGGHRELIRDGHNGHLFPAGSDQALADCLIKLLKAPETWSEVIANARVYVADERTWEASVARYRDVYATVIERARLKRGGAMAVDTPAVVLGAGVNGLGVARSLARARVRVWLLDADAQRPEMHTRAATPLTVRSVHGETLVEELVRLAEARFSGLRPVLLLTQEESVKTVSHHRDRLSALYRFSLPPMDMVDTLQHKQGFQQLAEKLGSPIPPLVHVRTLAELPAIERLRYPVVVKPGERHTEYSRQFKKAYRAESVADAAELIRRILPVMSDVVVQEWIEGPDANIYFCLQYLDKRGQVVGSFTGQKIRSWPPQVGGTASCVAAPEVHDELSDMTARFFQAAGVIGMASMEFKRDARSREFRMVEPTVGRTDYQEEVATLNGINLPYAAWCSELDLPFPVPAMRELPVVWRVRSEDIQSAAAQSQSLKQGCPSGAHVADALWRWRDPMPRLVQSMQRARRALHRRISKMIGGSPAARSKS